MQRMPGACHSSHFHSFDALSVLARWWNPGEISQATASKKNEATDQQMTVGVPEFVLVEWLPPKGKHFDWVLSGGAKKRVRAIIKFDMCINWTAAQNSTVEIWVSVPSSLI